MSAAGFTARCDEEIREIRRTFGASELRDALEKQVRRVWAFSVAMHDRIDRIDLRFGASLALRDPVQVSEATAFLGWPTSETVAQYKADRCVL